MVIYSKLILYILWLPQAIRQLLIWIYWIQTKEYRFDRFKLLLNFPSGRESLELRVIITKLVIFTLFFLLNEKLSVLIVILIILDLALAQDLASKRIKRPHMTQRAQRIFSISLLISSIPIIYGFLSELNVINFIFSEVLLLISPFIGVVATIPVVNKIKKEEIAKAKETINFVKPVVIGVTGSYGKSTTKEFIAHLLSAKYKTAKTSGSENTEFGIARKTKDFVSVGTKFFVVEMGAYKIGEIKKLTDIVTPQVGVITGIEEQHLSLFGSLNNIKKAKFELIDSLPEGGVAVFNLSNVYNPELAEKARKLASNLKVLGYYLRKDNFEKGNSIHADAVSEILSFSPKGVNFKISLGKDVKNIFAPVTGIHFIENLTGAILIARYYKVSWKAIISACGNIVQPENTMQIYKLPGGSTIIDDTHNTTPSAFESALNYLGLYKKNKIVVTSGMIELGDKTDFYHEKLGKHLKNVAGRVILTNPDFYQSIIKGLGNEKNILFTGNHKMLKSEFEKATKNHNNVILIEGRMPSYIINSLDLNKKVRTSL